MSPAESRHLLKLTALLLHYPGPGFLPLLAAVEAELKRSPDRAHAERTPADRALAKRGGAPAGRTPADRAVDSALHGLRVFCAQVGALDPVEREVRYVRAFDFNKDQTLWLTYHEVGDAIQRGSALAELKAQIEAAGFLSPAEELPDYIPLLLEFLAEKPPEAPDAGLPERLVPVLGRIAAALEKRDPLYAPVLRVAEGALLTRASTAGA